MKQPYPIKPNEATNVIVCSNCSDPFLVPRLGYFKYCSDECRKAGVATRRRQRYHQREYVRQAQIQRSMNWAKRNPERFKEIQTRYRVKNGLTSVLNLLNQLDQID